MSVIVFLGPSLNIEEARAILAADYRPPAAQGDVFRAARERPAAIALIDGVFERVPAVWHKEILWALSQGIHVWGASSMGALRAAELDAFGMVGVGAVYQQYRDDALDADDAVAVAHAGPEHGYRPLSVALVDVRATLDAACLDAVLAREEAAVIEHGARARFFADRSWPGILQDAVAAGLAPASAEQLRAWLSRGARSQKREDARALLGALKTFVEGTKAPFEPSFRFEHTDAWETFLRDSSTEPARAPAKDASDPLLHVMAADLALDGALDDARAGATILALARAEARRQGVRFDDDTLHAAAAVLRARHGLEGDESFAAWRDRNEIDDARWRVLLEDLAARTWFLGVLAPDSARHLPNHLRLAGRWDSLRSRSSQIGGEGEVSDDALVADYFERALGRVPPVDLRTWLLAAGFPSREAFIAALRRRSGR